MILCSLSVTVPCDAIVLQHSLENVRVIPGKAVSVEHLEVAAVIPEEALDSSLSRVLCVDVRPFHTGTCIAFVNSTELTDDHRHAQRFESADRSVHEFIDVVIASVMCIRVLFKTELVRCVAVYFRDQFVGNRICRLLEVIQLTDLNSCRVGVCDQDTFRVVAAGFSDCVNEELIQLVALLIVLVGCVVPVGAVVNDLVVALKQKVLIIVFEI